MNPRGKFEARVAILFPTGGDAELLANLLQTASIEAVIVPDADQLFTVLTEGVGAAVIAEEGLSYSALTGLRAWLKTQPAWSDPPFVILTSRGSANFESDRQASELFSLANFTLVERPVRQATLHSAIRGALRARSRQYEIRSHQEALMQANADLELFAHSASHDLREPVRAIGLFSEVLFETYADRLDDQGRAFLNNIRDSATRLDGLLTDLRSYAQTTPSLSDIEVPLVSAEVPLRTALKNLALALEESHAELVIGPMPIVRMRESHLSQVFQNLIGNAIKYRRDDRKLQIEASAREDSGSYALQISDNGVGIPEAYRETIFGLFQRLQTSNTHSGSGMGLAICQRIVERYGGKIWVESTAGEGATFVFTIPDPTQSQL